MVNSETSEPITKNLTRQETLLYICLIDKRLHSINDILYFLYNGMDEPDSAINILRLIVHRINPKIKPFGLIVVNDWGKGYRMKNIQATHIIIKTKTIKNLIGASEDYSRLLEKQGGTLGGKQMNNASTALVVAIKQARKELEDATSN